MDYAAQSRSEQYATLGLRTFAGPVYARSNVAFGASGGTAYEVASQTRVGSVNLQARYASADEVFHSEILGASVDSNFNATAHTQIRPMESVPFNIAFGFDRDHYRNNNTSFRLSNLISTAFKELSVANRIQQFWTPNSSRYTEGGLTLSRRVDPRGNTRLNAEFRYNITPNAKATGFSTRVTQNFPGRLIGSAGFSREFRGRSATEAGLAKEFDYFSASLSALYIHPADKTLFLMMSTGVGYVNAKKSLYAKPHPMGGSGSVIVRSYLDANQNSRWDYDELPVANATILINGSDSKVMTGLDGRAFIDQLTPYQPNDISLLTTTFADPSWVASIKGVNFIPRPGRIMIIEFPVVPTGELDGTVFSSQGGDTSEQPGVNVELLTLDGKVVRQEISAFDGFYLFQQIPMGRYQLRVSPSQLGLIGAQPMKAMNVEITVKSPVQNGKDMVIILK